ncbi:MAG: hypothetical protein H0W69_00550 [Gemmatimonadaceae bacterium]|nr:hypothetical protein [Gemmatimonadaceae bacterium]
MGSNKRRDGFAIPAAILVIALLTASIAAGFAMVSVERRAVEDQSSQLSAFALAQQGLETFLIKRDSLGVTATPPGARDSVRITYSNGYAEVIAIRMASTTNNIGGLYAVRSKGVVTKGSIAGTPQAVRTVAQLAKWRPAALQVTAGWASLSGLNKAGNSGNMTGVDACGDSATVAGVAVNAADGFSGHSGPISGNPPIDSIQPSDILLDWNNISSGAAFTPTVTIPPGSWPSFSDPNFYPVIYVKNGTAGNFSLPTGGRGTLIIQGGFTINGNIGWDGVMLIGGKMTSNGGSTINGAVLSGLNMLLSIPVDPAEADANGTKDYFYNSCSVAKAMAALGSFAPVSNTWVDSWVKY